MDEVKGFTCSPELTGLEPGSMKIYAPGWMEPVGHSPSHAPQSMQVSGLMLYWDAPSEIDSVGQTAAQAPQEMQVSSIT